MSALGSTCQLKSIVGSPDAGDILSGHWNQCAPLLVWCWLLGAARHSVAATIAELWCLLRYITSCEHSSSYYVKRRAGQAQKAQLGTYGSNQLSATKSGLQLT